SADKYDFQTVPGDPLDTKMYTLENGLKIYMSVNKDQPRIQTIIAVRVGGKNDPAETTGLAHYFEHLMFKGTEKFGTTDYAAEKPMLDEIEQLFEVYRKTTDEDARKEIYHKIDSISYQASLLAIPNEYDKLMNAIGASGTNAYTSQDMTCYVEDIPSNQLDNWARIQADRFEHPVIRGFHTELETIYEEKNMSLTQDGRKLSEAMLTAMFPTHPYGTQTVLGTQENLKNPSITNVKNYHKTWYVPNNIAICLAGDFNPDNAVDVIKKYFGHLKPNHNLPVLDFPAEMAITEPINREVWGNEAERLYLAWRIPEAKNEDSQVLSVIAEVLSNGKCGLIDLDINLAQTMLGAGAGMYGLADQGAFLLIGMPKGGQTLDDVRELLLAEMKKLREGDFDDELVPAIINNVKLDLQRSFESNESRASYYRDAFINGENWADVVKSFENLDKITKADVVAIANKYFGDNNYAAIYKRQGPDTNELKLSKPAITPIAMNRDASSPFLIEIQNSVVEPIEPVFVDFNKDLTRLTTKSKIPVLYTHNSTNDVFQLTYIYNVGEYNDARLGNVGELLELFGTPDMTPQDIQNEFYKLACSFRISIGGERSFIVISGLNENMPKAIALFEKIVKEAVADKDAYSSYVDRLEQARSNNKTNQRANFSALNTYMTYGKDNPQTNLTPIEKLRATDPEEFLTALRELMGYEHEIIYYGASSEKQVLADLNKYHKVSGKLKPAPEQNRFTMQQPEETIIFVAPYDAKQLYMSLYSNRGEKFDPAIEPLRTLYNEYFGGSMNAIVFQEMRESRSLAYSAGASMSAPGNLRRPYTYRATIATQNDKMMDATNAFDEIINNMPVSPAAFELAKKGIESRIRTERIIKDDIAWTYINARDLGLDTDRRIAVFEALPSITLDDVVKFQQDNVKGRTYYYCVLGDPNDIDLDALSKLGKVVMLTTEDIFGY
ncbi:MAG: insulinase family protein, partial [Muribaculaceae bacterium]|nr:insulinase family protein [Muribaculaceae bacterium]